MEGSPQSLIVEKKRTFFRFSVDAKLTALTAAIVLLTTLILALVSTRREFNSITQELERRGLVVCELTSKILADPLFQLDITTMQLALNDLMRLDDAMEITVTESSGRIVAASIREGEIFKAGLATGLMYKELRGSIILEPSVMTHPERMVVRYPIAAGSRPLGVLKLSMSLEPTRKRVMQTAKDIAMIGIIVGFIILVLSLMGAKKLMKPLLELTETAKNFGQGDLNSRAKIISSDEFADLGQAFNSMADSLQKNMIKLTSSNIELDRNLTLLKELHSFSVSLSSIFEIEELLVACVETLCNVLNSKRCSLLLRRPDDEGWYIKVAKGIGEKEITKNIPLPEEGAVASWVSKNKMPLLVVDSANDDRISAAKTGKYASTSFISTPLIAGNELIGILSVTDKASEKPVYTQWELSALNTFANQVAVAIENSRLHDRLLKQSVFERELELARDIQFNLLPSMCPDIDRLDIAADSIPATAVGGDFYDFMTHKDGFLTCIIGDVSGKGMAAAILMAMTKGFLRPRLIAQEDPAHILSNLNNFVFEQMNCTKFLTLFFCRINLEDLTMEYSNGGHNYPLIIHSDGTFEHLYTRDVMVGMFEGYQFTRKTVQLMSGDTILAYTDGLSESMNSSEEMLGEEGIERIAIENRHLGAEALMKVLLDSVSLHAAGAEQSDDITLTVLKVEK